jgi:subfamily B ATP-binding cassette protein MsbA
MADTESVRDLIGSGLVHFAGSSVTFLAALGYLFYLNASLTAMLLVVVLLFGGAIAGVFHHLRPYYREGGDIRAALFARLSEAIGGIRVVKTYAAEKREARAFTSNIHRLFRNFATTHMWWTANAALTTLAIGVVGVVLTILGGPAILAREMTVGQFLSYILFLALVFGPLEHVVWMGPTVSEALAALQRIHELLDEPTELRDDERRLPIGSLVGDVQFDAVSFEYDGGVRALSDVNVTVPAGATVALVGASGAGKSTLISLLMAFARPTTGRVLVDGRDLATIRLRDYRSQLGVVLQDNFLFDGTVRENLRYGRPGATDEQVRDASRVAHVDAFVRQLPLEYETMVGERGAKLSGGQRQRIAIARAILADPRILVLDEATSSLDSETEALIQDGLQALRRGRTTFVIAHRLSTVRAADLILVLEAGHIVERGTHAELLAQAGPYRRFYERQHAIDRDRLP